jgi:quercetin dioxygenase-like cupin family protein
MCEAWNKLYGKVKENSGDEVVRIMNFLVVKYDRVCVGVLDGSAPFMVEPDHLVKPAQI